MGRKFDKRLPFMTNDELARIDESMLDSKSRNRIEIERRKRAHKSESNHSREDRRRFNVTTIIALVALAAAIILGFLQMSQ